MPTRRDFLTSTGMWVGGCATGWAWAPPVFAGESDSKVIASPRFPEPKVVLPTDALPPPQGDALRLAAVTTAYWKYSHADDIITKFIEGYDIVGRVHLPAL